MAKIIFSIRVPAFFFRFPGRARCRGTRRRGTRWISARLAAGGAGDTGQGASAPAFLPARRGPVFQQGFKCPISFINTFGATVF